MTSWLLVDYGEVISRPPAVGVRADLAARLDLDPAVLDERYWQHRAAFDAGMPAAEYWSLVAGRAVDDTELASLVEVDRSSWATLDEDMVGLLHELRSGGVHLALLSNAPHWQADAFDDLEWTHVLDAVFVSARIGLTKPDPAVFEHVLGQLGAAPEDVVFVDDKQANVDGAASVGIRAIRFTGVEDLRRDLVSRRR